MHICYLKNCYIKWTFRALVNYAAVSIKEMRYSLFRIAFLLTLVKSFFYCHNEFTLCNKYNKISI
jgi:hypothetical protein